MSFNGEVQCLARIIPVTVAMLLAALCSLAVCGPAASAQESPTAEQQQELETLEGRIDTFFRSLTDKALDPEHAVREIIDNGPLKDRNEEINKLIEQTLTLDQRYGAYTGHERVGSKLVGEDLAFFRYLYKGDRFPVVWYFTFYRPAAIGGVQRQWALISLRFDAKVETLEK